jgi:Putative amidase domain
MGFWKRCYPGSTKATRSQTVLVGAILALLLAVVPWSTAVGASQSPSTGGPASSAVTKTIQAFLAEKAQRLVSGARQAPGSSEIQRSAALVRAGDSDDVALDARREQLKSLGEEYSGSKTRVEIRSSELTGAVMTVIATEETELDYKKIHGDEPPLTAYTADHVFTFEQTDTGWTLTGHRAASTDGLAPVTEVTAEAQTTGTAPDPHSAKTSRPVGPISPGNKLSGATTGPASRLAPMAIPAGLNYRNMVAYAIDHWGGAGAPYNSNYRDFSANGGGGDCTNFVSQALLDGGWQMTTGFWFDDNSWWYGWASQTHSWAGAQNWSVFAPQRTNWLGNVWYMGIADVLQIDFNRDGSKDHTMLVTISTSSQKYMTYHTTNTLNRSLSSILASYPSAWYYAYRT